MDGVGPELLSILSSLAGDEQQQMGATHIGDCVYGPFMRAVGSLVEGDLLTAVKHTSMAREAAGANTDWLAMVLGVQLPLCVSCSALHLSMPHAVLVTPTLLDVTPSVMEVHTASPELAKVPVSVIE
eukprot:gene16945-23220_t